jgi:hypothetical protein
MSILNFKTILGDLKKGLLTLNFLKMKKIAIVFLFLLISSICVFSQEQADKKRNEVEFAAFVANTTNFKFSQNFIPKIGYTRTLGSFIKCGVFYSRTVYSTGAIDNDLGLKGAFLPLSFFNKQTKMLSNWEIEIALNVIYNMQRGTVENVKVNNNSTLTTSTLALSRTIYKDFYIFGSVDIWNDNTIFAGIRYKF